METIIKPLTHSQKISIAKAANEFVNTVYLNHYTTLEHYSPVNININRLFHLIQNINFGIDRFILTIDFYVNNGLKHVPKSEQIRKLKLIFEVLIQNQNIDLIIDANIIPLIKDN